MDTPQKPYEGNERAMDLLRDYGREFLVFDTDDQPNVFAEAEVRFPPARGGRVNPKQMKNWRHFPRIMQLLGERYGLFASGRLITDCPLFVLKPRKEDDPKEFRKAFQVKVAKGLVWFMCRRGHFCGRKGCPTHKKPLLDIYDLICWLDGNRDLNHARMVVEEYFEVELANFPKASGSQTYGAGSAEQKAEWLRYAVPKEALDRLFGLPTSGRGAPQRFTAKAMEVITGAPKIPYDGHNADKGDAILFSRSFPWETRLKEFGAAARLFIWLHWKQAEAQRKLMMTHEEVAGVLGIPIKTIKGWTRELVKKGYVEVFVDNKQTNSWSAKYRSDAD